MAPGGRVSSPGYFTGMVAGCRPIHLIYLLDEGTVPKGRSRTRCLRTAFGGVPELMLKNDGTEV